jgi:hypothetical protein
MGDGPRDFPGWEHLTEDDYREIGRRATLELRTIIEQKQQRRRAEQERREQQQQPKRQGHPDGHD